MSSDIRRIEMSHADTGLVARMVLPEGTGPHPAVMVMSSAMGLGPPYLEIARKIAALGYVALATDMYGGGASFTVPTEAGPHYGHMLDNPALTRERTVAWFELLQRQPEVDPQRIGAIGYCFGGRCVLELARGVAALRLAVCFHGKLSTEAPASRGDIKAYVAVYTGDKDPHVPRQDIEAFTAEMKQAEAQWQLTLFGNVYHGFTSREEGALPIPGAAYSALADAQSWSGMLLLLKRHLAV